MGWENRQDGKKYYYRSLRIGGRVVKKYIGRGPKAVQAAREDELRRAKRAAAAAARRQSLEQFDRATEALEEFSRQLDILLEATLLAAGYHCHRGCWRRRRAQSWRIDHAPAETT